MATDNVERNVLATIALNGLQAECSMASETTPLLYLLRELPKKPGARANPLNTPALCHVRDLLGIEKDNLPNLPPEVVTALEDYPMPNLPNSQNLLEAITDEVRNGSTISPSGQRAR